MAVEYVAQPRQADVLSYEQRLQALGHLIDVEEWGNVAIVEHGHGFRVRGNHGRSRAAGPLGAAILRAHQTEIVVDEADMAMLVSQGSHRRIDGGQVTPAAGAGQPSTLFPYGYE